MEKFLNILKSRLARRIGFYVILASSILSIFTSGIQIYSEFEREKNGVYNILDQIGKTNISSIAARVWILDSAELNTSLINLLDLPSIRHISVFEDSKLLISVGEDIEDNVIIREFPLNYIANNTVNSIGRLVVKASLDEVYQRVFDRAILIILSNLVKTFIVAIFILFIFYKLVTKHLTGISNFLLQQDSFYGSNKLTLERPKRENDELDQLVNSINSMQKELRQQFNEINKQKQHLSQTLNSIGDAVISTDIEGNVIQMNPVAERLTGISNKVALHQSIKSVFKIINATTLETIDIPLDTVMKSGKIVHLSNQNTLLSNNGEQYRISDSAAPIKDEFGNILGMVLVFNDITEQYRLRQEAKLNAKKYRTLATIAPVGLFYTDVNGHCIYVNDMWTEIAGLSFNDAIGDGWQKAIDPDDTDNVYTAWRNFHERGVPFKLEYRFRNKDDYRWVLGQALAEEDSDGKVIGYVGTITDITDRKKAEYALHSSQKMEALGKLTGGIAHDYNNMLGVIIGYADLLKDKLGDRPALAGFVHEIYEAGQRGAKLTSKLLSFSRQKTTDSEVVNINTILLGEQNMLEKTLTVNIKLTLDLFDKLWLVNIDSNDLENAIVNLSINASYAMQGSGILVITTNNIYIEELEYVSLSVCDTGCGIKSEDKEKIFDPFYSTKGEFGTGLGLSQVYGFVERSGGMINVKSEPGEGSCFNLYFPRYINEREEIKTNKVDEINKLNGSEIILVVDDEPALIFLTTEILEKHGYKVLSAKSAKDALQVLENEKVDAMISDVIMPEMDGYELAEMVQKKYPEIKIQLASGFSDDRHLNMINNKTLHDNLLRKPYQVNALLISLRELLDL